MAICGRVWRSVFDMPCSLYVALISKARQTGQDPLTGVWLADCCGSLKVMFEFSQRRKLWKDQMEPGVRRLEPSRDILF